ncbi:precorrin-6y C5,15-methyltransferase (decarboxylating) subunit CbiE [Microlunatus ginsengisoli]|uniref:precorrin-6y C5,15-methyltransferase (decarboxylating) subunit CbiE n=1 Tax=Microlunatus ginsengisoli TaxID=363863 RepID=UPI0031D7BB31
MIRVVGLTARGWADLPEPERAIVREAPLVIGAGRLLDLVSLSPGQRAVEFPKPLRPGLHRLLADPDRDEVVVLASGDPLLSGIATTLLEEFGSDRVRVHPAVSSVALARARMGWPAECAETVSVVGRPVDRVRRLLAPGVRLVVLSADRHTPAALAALLVDAGYGASTMAVLGDLGSPDESSVSGLARGWCADVPQLNVVCVECTPDRGATTYGWTSGLPDEAFEHDGQLTKRDVRAAVLARLAPRPGELLWDLGAGAGSVAIEWCRAHPSCAAVAVERDADRVERIRRNAARLGVPELRVVGADTALAETFDGLPAPHAVFVGGGADAELLDRAWAALPAGGRLVVAAVTIETEQLLVSRQDRLGGELIRISVQQVEPLGRYRGWRPARPVVLWAVGKDEEMS